MIIVGNRTSTTVKSLETANGTYTYTYDAVGNILSINDGTYTVSYVYDGLNQLVRENDQRADTTTVYTYTNGNITGKKVYKYTLGNVGEEIKSTSYGYSNSEWRDLLTSFNGQAVTYDEIGNPLTFGSKTFEWCGRQLERITDGDNTYVYAYNTDGDRVSKTVNGVKTEYFYNGSILAGQKTGDETLIFMYDNNGDAFGFIYNGEEYYYIKNVQNDIVAIADKNGTVVANYYYDAWGNVTRITGNTALAQTNPLRYRSYYYDSETGYYHLKSRYYSPEVGRFLNADGYLAELGGNINGYNLFAYCFNNSVNLSDTTGHWPKWIKEAASWVNNNIIQPVKNFFSSSKQNNVVNASSHDANRRPYTGEPGSTYTAPNGDSRTYGPDGNPEHDYDHDDHGRPDKHPHDSNGGHNHDWKNGVRGPAYSIGLEPIAGVALVTVCAIGIVVVATDDVTGIGVIDDFLFGPLGAGVGEGLILIFG